MILISHRFTPLAVLGLALSVGCENPSPRPTAGEPGDGPASVGEPAPTEEEAPDVADRAKGEEGEEGKMGKPTSKSKTGLYAMKGPKDAEAPPAAPGVGGLGLVGTGRGGGGTGQGTIGLGNTGLIGKGGGGGTGSGYGRGSGAGFGGRGMRTSVAPPPPPPSNTEAYDKIDENELTAVADEPLSTFSIDVDTASYSNVRRFVQQSSLPPIDAVRLEEMVNYFDYDYPEPAGKHPFSITTEVATSPWNDARKLLHVGIKGKSIDFSQAPNRNLVFLLDVSGSMNAPDKLPLLKQGMGLLVRDLRPQDKISIVVYAGASGMVLPPTTGKHIDAILDALGNLRAGGSTNGGAGIQLAYQVAKDNFIKGGINRVVLATDGDFNVGTSSQSELERMIEEKRKTGVFLTVLGFGTGNTKDSTMEMLADKGNGNYAYIDNVREARKVLVREAGSTLITIAKDVKIQVEFNPTLVSRYRLVGYENRKLAARDFNDDTKDAGEIGAGTTVTALYELEMAGGDAAAKEVDDLKYQKDREPTGAAQSSELLTVKFRYKRPDGDTSTLVTRAVTDDDRQWVKASESFRWSAAVAMVGMLLRESKHKGNATLASSRALAAGARGQDPGGDRQEFLRMIDAVEKIGLDGTRGALAGGYGGSYGGGRRVPRVRQAKATVDGDLDKDIIRRIVRAHINEVRACYNQGLTRNPNLQGRVEIAFSISGKGAVSKASVAQSTLKDASVGSCIASATKRWKFPKPRDGEPVAVKYPYNLSPG
jgi:Ca-activated chloride channel family protein